MRILLLEDDTDLAEVVALGLRDQAYAVDTASTYAAADEMLRTTDFDVACFDLGLPDGDGLDLLRRLAVDPDLHRPRRTLVPTARDAVTDRVAGLDAGADDYLVKPFAFSELFARIRAVGRREDDYGLMLQVGELTVDLATRRAWRANNQLKLTAREFSLLRYFMHHPGRVLSAEELLEHVWDANADPFTSSVRVILSRLRRKLGGPPLIATITKRRLPARSPVMRHPWRSLLGQLALFGFLAIYLPVLAHPHPTVEEYRRGLERSRSAAARLRSTLDELLLDARGRARTIDRQSADLVDITRTVVDEASVLAAAKSVTCRSAGHLPPLALLMRPPFSEHSPTSSTTPSGSPPRVAPSSWTSRSQTAKPSSR